MEAQYSTKHPHEPEIPPTLDDEGRCLICAMTVQIRILTEALSGLFVKIGDPQDIDQDCRFCTGHYGEHSDDCVWAIARNAL